MSLFLSKDKSSFYSEENLLQKRDDFMKENSRMVFATNSNEAEKLCKVTEYFFGVFGWRNFDVSELSLQRVRNRRLLRIQRELGLNEDSLHKYLTLLANYGFFTQKSCGEYSINTNGWLFTRPTVGERNKLLFNALVDNYKCITRERETFPYRWIFRYLNDLGGHCSKLELGALFLISSVAEYHDLITRVRLSRERNCPEMIADVYADYLKYGLVSRHDIRMIVVKDITRPTALLTSIGVIHKIHQTRNNMIEIPGGLRVNAEQNIILTESGKEMVERFMRGMTRTFANFS